MKDPINQTNLKEKRDTFLDRACLAEAAGNSEEAERLFIFALRCEELSQSEKNGIQRNVLQATPENGNNQPLVKIGIQEIDHETCIENQ